MLQSCAGEGGGPAAGQRAAAPESPAAGAVPSYEELHAALLAEFERLGIDPDKVVNAAPVGPGNSVFDLAGTVIDPDGPEGLAPPTGIELSWTERQLGDYDMNGEVNVADLTPLGINFGRAVSYDEAELHGGIRYWPAGDPDNAGALNWFLARVDGDANGVLTIADVTPIGQNWRSSITGYRVYRSGPDSAEFELLLNSSEPTLPYTLARPTITPQQPVRYSFTDTPAEDGLYVYYVVAYHAGADSEADWSNLAELGFNATVPENVLPLAELSSDLSTGGVPLLVSFDASASVDPDGVLVRFEWDFDGDGLFDLDSAATPQAQHTYEEIGEYTAVLRVTDERGGTDTAELDIEATFPPNQAPHAEYTVVSLSGSFDADPPIEVEFDASASSDPDGHGLSYYWDYEGDGEYDEIRGTGEAFTYTYLEPGTYVPALQVRDSIPEGALTDTMVYEGEITVRPNQPPVAVLTATPTEGDLPLFVEFDASGSFDPSENGGIVYYEWDLDGDREYESAGPSMTTRSFTYTESKPFVLATVRVTDNAADTKTDSVVITLPYVEGWVTAEIYQSSGAGLHNSAMLIDGHPAACFNLFGVGLMYVRAEDPLGMTWGDLVDVDTIWLGEYNRYGKGQFNNLMLVEGRPAVVYFEDSAGSIEVQDPFRVRYVRALDALGESWGPGLTIAAPQRNFSGGLNAALVGGNPAVTWCDSNSLGEGTLHYSRAFDALGQQWSVPFLVSKDNAWDSGLIELSNGLPLVSYHRPGASARTVSGQDQAGRDWLPPALAPGGRFNELKMVKDYPALVFHQQPGFTDYFNLNYVRALDPLGKSWGEPVYLQVGPGNRCGGFAIINDKPAVAFINRSGEQLMYRSAADETGSVWNEAEVVLQGVTGPDAGWIQLLEAGNGQPHIVFRRRESSNSHLRGMFAATYFPPQDPPAP